MMFEEALRELEDSEVWKDKSPKFTTITFPREAWEDFRGRVSGEIEALRIRVVK